MRVSLPASRACRVTGRKISRNRNLGPKYLKKPYIYLTPSSKICIMETDKPGRSGARGA